MCRADFGLLFGQPTVRMWREQLSEVTVSAASGQAACWAIVRRSAFSQGGPTAGPPSPARQIANPILTVDKNGQRHFSQMAWINKGPTTSTIWKPPSKPRMAPDSSKGSTSHIYAEVTSNTRHWASRDTTSSGTRIHNTLSHEACSFRPLSSLLPVFAAWI